MPRALVEWLLFAVGLLVTVGLPWLVWRRLAARRPSTTPQPLRPDGAGGWIVPVLATFAGVRGLPWLALATNSLNPHLAIRHRGIVHRVVRERARRDAEIERVDLRVFGATVNLCFTFRRGSVTVTANVGSLALAADALRLLHGRVPLGEAAAALADG